MTRKFDQLISWFLDHQGPTLALILFGYFVLLWEMGLLEG